jgi:hypothetical protein
MHEGGKMNIVSLHRKRTALWWTVLTCVIAAVLIFQGGFSSAFAAGTPQESFPSPGEAVQSLVTAVRAEDMKQLRVILGPGSETLISSGDDAADRVGREKFIKAYDQRHRLEQTSASKTVLHIGDDDWSLPIPVVKKGDTWVFDIRTGKQEILNRRIGRNELHVMDVLHAYVDAQHEYATKDCKGGGSVEFAQQLISTEGKHDGLYWKTEEGEEMSPLGPLVARAAKEGYANPNLSPFHGYYFRILKSQGKRATGGAYSYVVKGKMILGFALVAYPAEYGNSGIMSFIVNQEGIIFEKNLGRKTKHIAEAMKIFDPDKTWKAVGETSPRQGK